MERKRVKNIFLMILLIVFVVTGLPLISQAEKAATQPQKKEPPVEKKQAEKAPVEKTQTKKATLNVVPASGNTALIELTNTVPVRGMQFTVNGVKMTEVRTTARTKGFLAKFNEENGIVIMVSLTKDEMAPGKGPIAEIVYQKAPPSGSAISLSAVKIVGTNREEL